MFRSVRNAVYILSPAFFALVLLLAPAAPVKAQAIIAEHYGIPQECEIPENYNSESSGFGNAHSSNHFTNTATNPATNRTYVVLHCFEGPPARLLEINGNDGSQSIIVVPLDPPGAPYASVTDGIAVDHIRNRIYLNIRGGELAGLVIFDMHTGTQ